MNEFDGEDISWTAGNDVCMSDQNAKPFLKSLSSLAESIFVNI